MLMFPKEKATKHQRRWRDARPGMSPTHLKRVRRLPCCVCRRPGPSEAHHLKQTGAGERGMGLKSTDRWAVPMCNADHFLIENAGSKNEVEWFHERGVDVLGLANGLWDRTLLGHEELEAVFSEHTPHNLLRME